MAVLSSRQCNFDISSLHLVVTGSESSRGWLTDASISITVHGTEGYSSVDGSVETPRFVRWVRPYYPSSHGRKKKPKIKSDCIATFITNLPQAQSLLRLLHHLGSIFAQKSKPGSEREVHANNKYWLDKATMDEPGVVGISCGEDPSWGWEESNTGQTYYCNFLLLTFTSAKTVLFSHRSPPTKAMKKTQRRNLKRTE